MKKSNKIFNLILSSTVILALILDGKTALEGASEGVKLCTASVIPSLFPFMTFGFVLNSALTDTNWKPIRTLGRICGIPTGGEALLLLGFLGGYPVGAQCINDAYRNNNIERKDALRMLAFCSNAGPAFVFGIGGTLFKQKSALWALWLIHILSALIVAFLLRTKDTHGTIQHNVNQITVPEAVTKGIRTTAVICGWVILFRILITFCKKYFFRCLCPSWQIGLSGILELTNGFHGMNEIPHEGTKFLFAACILGFGGVCVTMQTISVTKDVGTGLYFPGKITQCALSFFLSASMCCFLFPAHQRPHIPMYIWLLFITLLFTGIIILRKEKNSSFTK